MLVYCVDFDHLGVPRKLISRSIFVLQFLVVFMVLRCYITSPFYELISNLNILACFNKIITSVTITVTKKIFTLKRGPLLRFTLA